MATITNTHSSASHSQDFSSHQAAAERSFSAWCQSLEPQRILVMTFMLMVQGCIFAPVVLLLSQFFNKGITGPTIALAAVSGMAVMVANISILPMKAIVVIFITSVVINLALIAIHIF